MKTIYKYPLAMTDYVEMALPQGAEVLCVGMQGDQAFLWAVVYTGRPLRFRRFRVYGTGHTVQESDDARTYVGTVHIRGFVFHVFSDGTESERSVYTEEPA